MVSKNLTPEGQRKKYFDQRNKTVRKKLFEIMDICHAEFALYILPKGADTIRLFQSRPDFPEVSTASHIEISESEDYLQSLARPRTRTSRSRRVDASDPMSGPIIDLPQRPKPAAIDQDLSIYTQPENHHNEGDFNWNRPYTPPPDGPFAIDEVAAGQTGEVPGPIIEETPRPRRPVLSPLHRGSRSSTPGHSPTMLYSPSPVSPPRLRARKQAGSSRRRRRATGNLRPR